ncbi:4-hydroxyphenylacetate 3-monooxygenase [Bacillus mesophilus]|uniref:4-hydroxyphenylacetate 3-monooxygenase, oxygenase component n=1 Tax=Bacillus mesophilus TaxID=1808955 RepID=A0A6M0Q526_9BACI|nr:4-hydroxyphenylacetate 3-monooxygenase, oxygenase component [Bacillus mesophilus]MBM7661009.1 4-hydroxyphenylacetate 3-monooxygenase [Bacillus mesophilus]NEY71451.1 4-hydroxyphenylacetate 3-monooxygenase, oxygenase component [Bacillus mesophilus]
MSAISGKEYMNRIDRLKSNVWVNGEKVNGNISVHPSFKGVISSQANLYDLQLDPKYKKKMTYPSPLTGHSVGASYLIPKSKEDLEFRRIMIKEWAKQSAGLMGRSPDYMNTALMSFAAAKELFGEYDSVWEQNVWNFYELAREQDLSFTHTFVNPQVNRSSFYFTEFEDDIIAAQVVDQNEDGIVIKGARLLATQGGMTDELMVFPGGGVTSNSLAYAFSIPSNTKGLKFICREPYSYRDSTFDHPLASKFDEIDTIVVFDHVLVPWNRVFFHNNMELSNKLYSDSSFFPLVLHQVITRRWAKLEFLLGLAHLLVDTIQIQEYEHIQGKISEIIISLETIKALLESSELNSGPDRFGTWVPALNPLYVAATTFPTIYPRMTEIIQLLGASGLASLPTEEDFTSEIKPDLELYLRSATLPAKERVQLYRLAWDYCMSAFGSRQTLYERFFFGDPVKLQGNLFKRYDRGSYVDMVNEFLQRAQDS